MVKAAWRSLRIRNSCYLFNINTKGTVYFSAIRQLDAIITVRLRLQHVQVFNLDRSIDQAGKERREARSYSSSYSIPKVFLSCSWKKKLKAKNTAILFCGPTKYRGFTSDVTQCIIALVLRVHVWRCSASHWARIRIERSWFEPWPGTLCCVLGKTLLSQCLSSPRCLN